MSWKDVRLGFMWVLDACSPLAKVTEGQGLATEEVACGDRARK
jgi:hypothetical protein